MRIRRIAVVAAVVAATAVPAAVGGLASPAFAAGTCTDQFTGASLPVTPPLGTNGRDTLIATADSQVIDALAGGDTVRVGPGLEAIVICLGDGADQVTGNNGAPDEPLSVMGGPGNDSIIGGSANDVLNGGSGTDFIDGGPGVDVCKNVESAINCEIIQN